MSSEKRRGHGRGPMMGPGEKAKDFKGSIGKLAKYMSKYKIKPLSGSYTKVILAIYVFASALRIIESLLVFNDYGFKIKTLTAELIGWGYDLLFVGIVAVLYFPFYFLASRFKKPFVKILNVTLLCVVLILRLCFQT